MRRALTVARELHDPGAGDLPAGAVLYDADGNEVAAAHHDRASTYDPTAHAEMTVLRAAGAKLRTWRMHGCILVTTLEPCTMCAGAISLARIPTLVIGSWDDSNGAICSMWDVVRDRRLNHFVEVIPEVLREECDALLHSYWHAPPLS
ncbi:nucleoside deaminase [Amycolatopsis palatopharyngis]|uniref:nucleoside deaminase n=1 Tax=Amycolatopsis palatopharyngis TaxID=187982 RepID=UPI000E278773|nr:nucleoside deaminase [Amycolatopsis palatopharyngis]